MKKIIYCLLFTCLSLTLLPLQSSGATTDKPSSAAVTKAPEPVRSAEVKNLLKRVDKFSTIDKTTLRKPASNNTQVVVTTGHHHNGVGYISAGGVILIILLVVILL